VEYKDFLGLAMRNPSEAMKKLDFWRETHPDNTEKAFTGVIAYLSDTLPSLTPGTPGYNLARQALVVAVNAQSNYVRSGLLHESLLLFCADLGDLWIASGNEYDFSWGVSASAHIDVPAKPENTEGKSGGDTGDTETTTEGIKKVLSERLSPLDYATITKSGVTMQVFPLEGGKYALRITGVSAFKLKRLTPRLLDVLDGKVSEVFS